MLHRPHFAQETGNLQTNAAHMDHILQYSDAEEAFCMNSLQTNPRAAQARSTLLDLLENVIAAQFEAEAAGKTV